VEDFTEKVTLERQLSPKKKKLGIETGKSDFTVFW